MTIPSKNDIFLQTMVRGILTNRITPVLCVNRLLDLGLNEQEEQAVSQKLENMLAVKNVTMASLFKNAYRDAVSRREDL